MKNGSPLPLGSTIQLPVKTQAGIVINEKLVMIKSVAKAEEGNYTCQVLRNLQPKWQDQKTLELRVDSE